MDMKGLVEVCTEFEIIKAPLNLSSKYGNCLFGLCQPDTKKIYLEPRQDHVEMRDSFIHEALHAHLYITGKAFGMGDDEQERYVKSQAKRIMSDLYGRKK